MIALVFLGLISLQDPDVDALLKQLSDESLQVREKAAAALIALGDRAEGAVKARMSSAEGELKKRLEAVLRDIGKARRLRAVFPSVRRITFDAKDEPVREVMARLAKETGLEFSRIPARGANVTLSLKDALPLEALDAACKAANLDYLDGMSRSGFGRRNNLHGNAIALSAGYRCLARSFSGPFVVDVSSIHVSLEQNKTQLSLALYWPPAGRPKRVEGMEVTSAVDDQGTHLLPDVGLDGSRDTVLGELHQEMCIRLNGPAPEAKKITLKGRGTVLFSLDQAVLAFKKPADCVGQERSTEQFTIRLEKCSLEADGARFRIQVKQLAGVSPRRGIYAYEFSNQNIRLALEDGSFLPNGSYTASNMVKGGATVDLEFRNLKAPVASLEFLFDTEVHREDIVFEFKDVPLPK